MQTLEWCAALGAWNSAATGARRVLDGRRKKKLGVPFQFSQSFPLIRLPKTFFLPRLQPCPARKAAKPRCVRCHVCSRNRGREPRQPQPRAPKKQSSPTAFSDTLLLPAHKHSTLQPLKKPKAKQADLDDDDKAFLQKKKEEAAALKALREKAASKGGFAKVKGSK